MNKNYIYSILKHIPDPLIFFDKNGNICYLNKLISDLFNIDIKIMEKSNFNNFVQNIEFSFTKVDKFHSFIEIIKSNSTNYIKQSFSLLINKTQIHIELLNKIVYDQNNNSIGYLWIIKDISECIFLRKEIINANKDLTAKVMQRTMDIHTQNNILKEKTDKLNSIQVDIEMELDIAKKVQASILPSKMPNIKSLNIADTYIPTHKVGGDFYNLVELDKEHLFILIADVSGHGVPAAMISMMADMSICNNMQNVYDFPVFFNKINRELYKRIKTDHYLTAAAFILNYNTGLLKFSRICHCYPLIYRSKNKTVDILKERGGFFLGMFEETEYESFETYLFPGDRLLLYTDGITESLNIKKEMYEVKRLIYLLKKFPNVSSNEFNNILIEDRNSFTGTKETLDDITVLTIDRLNK